MMRKKILRFYLMMATVVSLYSCQQELLQTEQDAALQSRKLNVQRLNHEQLQQKHSLTLEKINSLSPKKISGRMYTDTENGFSVDTEKALLIEDDKGNKSYTFGITRTQPNPELYENLVLKDKGNNMYSAFIMQYKKILFRLPNAPSGEELNNYISILDLGTKSGSAIFGKTLVCYKTFANNSYIPGIPCINGHTNPAVCDLTGDAAPVPGYWVTGYDVMPYLCDNNPDPFNTVPLEGGGGSWNGNPILPPEMIAPCRKLKDLLNPAKTNVKPLITGGMYSYIDNSSTGEGGIYLKKDASGNITTEVAPYTAGNTVDIKASGLYYSAIHTHPKSTYPMFSWTDIYNLYLLEIKAAVPFNRNQTSFLLVCEDENGIKQTYAIIFEDFGIMMEDTLNNPKYAGCTPEEICEDMDKKIEKQYNDEQDKSNPNYERIFLQFNLGTNVGLYKANSDLTNWSKLSINENTDTSIVNSTNCN